MTNPDDAAFERPILGERENGMAYCYCHGGLTKREYFAAIAMQGMIHKMKPEIGWMKKCAIHSIQMADALIAELNK